MCGSRLIALRKARGLKIEDVASKLGVSTRAYYSYENDERDPSTLTLAKIAIFFGVSADYLIGIENEISSSQNNDELNNIMNLVTKLGDEELLLLRDYLKYLYWKLDQRNHN